MKINFQTVFFAQSLFFDIDIEINLIIDIGNTTSHLRFRILISLS